MADLPIRHEDLYHGIAVPQKTWFRRSCFHTPSELAHELFLTALRPGEVRAASDYRSGGAYAAGRICFTALGAGDCAGGRPHIPRDTEGNSRGSTAIVRTRTWPIRPAPSGLLWARVDGAHFTA